MDLSSASDLTAFVRMANVSGKWHVTPTFWLPEDGIRERSRTDHVPYDVWAKEGYIKLTPGRTVEYEYVAQRLFDEFTSTNLKRIAFDRWGFNHLRPWLIKAGFTEHQIEHTFVEFGQGYQSMSPALRTLEAMIMNKKLVHGNNPVLAMCARNSVVTSDPAGNRKLNKARSRGRIDGMVALAMAAAVAETVQPVEKFDLMFV